jgi:hypothetical protein
MRQENELLEALDDWANDFKKKCHPASLTLLRAATTIRRLQEEIRRDSPPGQYPIKKEAYGIIRYWQELSECTCESNTPAGKCFKCDMEKLEDRFSELIAILEIEVKNTKREKRNITDSLRRVIKQSDSFGLPSWIKERIQLLLKRYETP